jgi:hypothetical protein
LGALVGGERAAKGMESGFAQEDTCEHSEAQIGKSSERDDAAEAHGEGYGEGIGGVPCSRYAVLGFGFSDLSSPDKDFEALPTPRKVQGSFDCVRPSPHCAQDDK